MKRTWVYDKHGNAREVTPVERKAVHAVHPDFEEHGGRAKFREHLKRTDSVELGHSDIRSSMEKWSKKKRDAAEEMVRAQKIGVREAEDPTKPEEIREYQRSRINNEVRNRLEGRPMPPIETIVKLALEEARRLR